MSSELEDFLSGPTEKDISAAVSELRDSQALFRRHLGTVHDKVVKAEKDVSAVKVLVNDIAASIEDLQIESKINSAKLDTVIEMGSKVSVSQVAGDVKGDLAADGGSITNER
jgi:hypothetical protein